MVGLSAWLLTLFVTVNAFGAQRDRTAGCMQGTFAAVNSFDYTKLPAMGDQWFCLKGAGCDKDYKNEECDNYCRERVSAWRLPAHLHRASALQHQVLLLWQQHLV
ncbi:hypothetical protein AAVH_24932 [Aphelenchoides avenae]|nr:hypothetical protein AAVH_24932 [Aphelenchus avenae]